MSYLAGDGATPLGTYTVSVALATTAATSLVSNAAASGRVYKIISIVAANVDGTNAADISVSRYSAAALGGTAYALASTVSVPADASLVIADATTPVMLPADASLGATAGASNDIVMTVTYEEYLG